MNRDNQITLLFAEAALETFPQEIIKDLNVRRYLQKLRKKPSEIILDESYHSQFMKNLVDKEKRGRPDIVHLSLLAAYSSILARESELNVIIHTYDNKIIHINPKIRLPKRLERFNGLILQLYKFGKVPKEAKFPFLTLNNSSLNELMVKLRKKHDIIIVFDVDGDLKGAKEYSSLIANAKSPLLVFGAFPHGNLNSISRELYDYKISIYKQGLELFIAVSHVLSMISELNNNSNKISSNL